MRTKWIWIAPAALLFTAGTVMASGMGGGMGDGSHAGSHGNGVVTGGGAGYGMKGAGGMMSNMWRHTLNHSYLDVLAPIGSAVEAAAAVNAFLSGARSELQITELWEYSTVYKAEIVDTNGNRAFDVLADKLTGAVQPEMGLSMMLNASYGSALQRTPKLGRKLALTAEQATAAAQAFLDRNSAVPSLLGYILDTPEAYPGFYKFHTTDSAGQPGMDVLVNGYNGEVWMDTVLGVPRAQVLP